MKRIRCISFLMLLVVTAGMLQAAEWTRKSAALMTSWGEQIDPENVWQEYPRPQLVRPDWMNLNGVWEYFRREGTTNLTVETTVSKFNKRILVPFGWGSPASGVKDEADIGWYRRDVTVPAAWKERIGTRSQSVASACSTSSAAR